MKKIFLMISVLISINAWADIREAPTMESAVEGADKDTLVIFDLDNTVMMPPQALGGEEWYDYFVAKRTQEFQKNGLSESAAKDKAIDQGLAEWNQFHRNAKVVPVEESTPKLISELQKKGARTMALTARPKDLNESTIAQLKSIGIDFQTSTVANKALTLPGKNPAQFYKGALMVGPKNKKGEVLVQFLNKLKLKPKKIIFVDNKLHHVENVGKALSALKIDYFGRRHAAADSKIAAMDKAVVETQHKYFFGDVLSNDDAKKLK